MAKCGSSAAARPGGTSGGGFVQVADNVVSVLTSRAFPSPEIDPRIAAEHLATARSRRATNDALLDEREALQNQARAEIRAARKT